MHKWTVALFSTLYLTLSAPMADSKEMDIKHLTINEVELRKSAKWLSYLELNKVKERASNKLKKSLDLPIEALDNVSIARVFTSNWYQVSVDQSIYIIDENADYWMQGSAIGNVFIFDDTVTPVNVNNETREMLSKIVSFVSNSPEYAIVYKPRQISLGKIFVFMDLSCPFCREFHLSNKENILNEGYELWYIPFIRDENKKSIKLTLETFCSFDNELKKSNINNHYIDPKNNKMIASSQDCSPTQKAVLDTLMRSGGIYSLTGTPLFITESTGLFYGYSAIQQHISKSK